MKNDSHLFPFEMLGDSFFDSNKDGKLTGFETIMRDAHHLEMMNKANQETKSKTSTPLYHHNDTVYKNTPGIDENNKQPENQVGSGTTIFACGLVIFFVIIAFAIALNTENDFIRILAMFGSAGLGILVLKAFGLLKT
ncbi:MAG: hypothetical protein IJ643_10320 [Eubacterium sp.]|nr:hypothetical protein [Eubacterium sp.]